MQRQLTAFVEQPSKQTFLAVRAAVLRATPLPIAATALAEVERLLDEGSATEVLDRIDALPPAKVLSPRVHLLAAEAADLLGDAERSELERFLFVLVLRGLLATGDGTPANPYAVSQATDGHDIAEALGLEPASQSLVDSNGSLCDVLVCSDGRELWLDLTETIRRPRQSRPPQKSAGRAAKRRPAGLGRSRR